MTKPRLTPVLRFTLFGLCLSALATGCGFHLKQATPARIQFTSMDIEPAGRDSTAAMVQDTLLFHGIRIDQGSPYHLQLSKDKLTKRSISLDARAQSVEFRISRSAQVTLQCKASGALLLDHVNLEAQRTFIYRSEEEAAMQIQETALARELQQEIANKVLTLLQNAPTDCQRKS